MSLEPHIGLTAKVLVSDIYEPCLLNGYDSFVADESAQGSVISISRKPE